MEKVEEPNVEEIWQCPRCHQDYCRTCVDRCEVDFEVEDKPDGYNENIIQWKELQVCPWCYNQLIDLKNGGMKSDSSKLVM